MSTPDKHTAVVHHSKPQLHDLANYGDSPRLIVPAHVWKKHNPKTWTNKQPVGTGPFTLESFGTQSIKLKVRDDYWNGKFNGVKHAIIKAFGSEESGKQMILKNKATWAGMSWQDYDKNFVKQDTKKNHYWRYPQGSSLGILFSSKKAPTNDVHLRRALYYALDSKKLLKLFDDGSQMVNPSGLESEVWKKFLPEDLRKKQHKQDVGKAKAELKKSGYKVTGGKLVKKGKSYPLSLKTNADYAVWKAWAPGMRSQWKDALGLHVSVKQSPTDKLGEDQAEGNFQMLFDFLAQGEDIWSALNMQLGKSYLKPFGESANGNYGRYHNSQVDKLLSDVSRTRDPKKLKKDATGIERTVVDEVPYGSLFSLDVSGVVNGSDWTGWPDRDHPKYLPHIKQTVDNNLTMQHLKPNATK